MDTVTPAFGDASPTIELLQYKDLNGFYEDFNINTERGMIQKQINNPGYEKFTITVKDLGDKKTDFGIAIGCRIPELRGSWPFFYLFLTHISYSVRFNVWGGLAFGKSTGRTPINPNTIWQINELESMELHFDKGHIQWYADGEKRADFKDPEFPAAEILGFVVIGDGVRVGYVWADSFTISGPGLSVSPKAKLTTSWGQLKQLE